jgi:hypothetical protein
MGEAAKISLKAIGKQDTHLLSKDPEDSVFKYNLEAHSNFVKTHKVRNIRNDVTPGWPFGQTIKVEYSPQNMGDLLTNMWIKINLPNTNQGFGDYYSSYLGRHLIKSITMYVDELEIEKLTDDWMFIYDQLHLDSTEIYGTRPLVNMNLVSHTPTTTALAQASRENSIELLIPIKFFFSQKYAGGEYEINTSNKNYFPVCSIYRQKIIFEIDFHKQSFFTGSSNQIEINNFDIITEEITLSKEERTFLSVKERKMISRIVKKHPTTETEYNKDEVRIDLVPDLPVSCFHWFLRDVKYEESDIPIGRKANGEEIQNFTELVNAGLEEEDFNFLNRFNFSKLNYNNNDVYIYPHIGHQRRVSDVYDILKSAFFFINENKLPNISNPDSMFYKLYIPFHHRLNSPEWETPIYTYSFSFYPKNENPSGTLDFSTLKSRNTNLRIEIKPNLTSNRKFNVHMYYLGFVKFEFRSGFMSIVN